MQHEHVTNGKCATVRENGPGASTVFPPQGSANKRGEPRHTICAGCQLWVFHGPEPSARHADGIARNLSFKGIALVSDVSEPIPPGRPVEVVVNTPNEPRTHAAGTVAYCSMIAAGCFEFGIRVEAAGADPILIGDPGNAARTYDWFAAALKVPD